MRPYIHLSNAHNYSCADTDIGHTPRFGGAKSLRGGYTYLHCVTGNLHLPCLVCGYVITVTSDHSDERILFADVRPLKQQG
ncbi:hypothetical protein CBM2637_B40065 [Cupriavidus taiwanensis]|nr:hypothetical protein CBM2637_B40065 [Cupriavidus taiwanensis]